MTDSNKTESRSKADPLTEEDAKLSVAAGFGIAGAASALVVVMSLFIPTALLLLLLGATGVLSLSLGIVAAVFAAEALIGATVGILILNSRRRSRPNN